MACMGSSLGDGNQSHGDDKGFIFRGKHVLGSVLGTPGISVP